MFRALTRKKQALSSEECSRILKQAPRGVLSLLGDHGYPYGLPINFYYDEAENRIYFHSGKTGHKMDAIAACDKASFCVYDAGTPREGHWSLDFKSVIVFGKITRADELPLDKIIALSKKHTQDTDYIDAEIRQFAAATAMLVLEIEHICGKAVNEA